MPNPKFVLLVLLTPVDSECSQPRIHHGWHIVSEQPFVSWPILCSTDDGRKSWSLDFSQGHKTVTADDIATVQRLCPECLAAFLANPTAYQFAKSDLGRYSRDRLPDQAYLQRVGLVGA